MICEGSWFVLYLIIDFCKVVLPATTVVEVKNLTLVEQLIKELYQLDLRNQTNIITMFQMGDDYQLQLKTNANKTRFKRQGKFTEAAKQGQTKLFRQQMQLFKNLFVKNPVGPVHPLHVTTPQIFMQLFRQRIVGYFSPDITVPPKTDN